MNKYYLIGPPGAGKTTETSSFRRSNSSFTIIELDSIVWLNGWKKKNQKLIQNEILELLNENDKIIFEGCYPELLEFFEKNNCTILFLDTGLFVCLKRVIYRSLHRILNKVQIFGNRESFFRLFHPNGIIFYTIRNYFFLRKNMKKQKRKGKLRWKLWKNFYIKHYR